MDSDAGIVSERMEHRPDRRDSRVAAGQGGQAIAEFAIVFPLMLLMVLAIVQISLMFVAKSVVEYSAFAAARAEVVGEDPEQAAAFVCSTIAGPSRGAGAGRFITVPGWGDLPRSAAAFEKTLVDVMDPGDNGSGHVTVEVTHYYELIVPVVSMIFKPISRSVEPGDVPQGIFITLNDAPHMVLKSRYTRPVPWDEELKNAHGHPVIPDLSE